MGAIGNLINILHRPKNDMEQFWDILQSPVHLILQRLGESSVPKAVIKSGGECVSIQKSLWVLCKKNKFGMTSALQMNCFQNLQEAINYEIPSCYFGERNTCLLSSRCCYMEGDDNLL